MSCESPSPIAEEVPEFEDILHRWRGRCDDVHVAGYNDELYDEDRSATFYLVFFNGNMNFVKKRYTQFLELYDLVKHRCEELSSGRYRFPNKSIFNTGAKFTKERRKRGFDELLKILVADGGFERELMLFLDLPYQYSDDDTDNAASGSKSPPKSTSLAHDASDEADHTKDRAMSFLLEYENESSSVIDDPWPMFNREDTQNAMAASLLLYIACVYFGVISVAGSTWLRISLTVLLLAYCLLLAQRIVQPSASSRP